MSNYNRKRKSSYEECNQRKRRRQSLQTPNRHDVTSIEEENQHNDSKEEAEDEESVKLIFVQSVSTQIFSFLRGLP